MGLGEEEKICGTINCQQIEDIIIHVVVNLEHTCVHLPSVPETGNMQ